MKKVFVACSALALAVLFIGPALGCNLSGKIYCDVGTIGAIDPSDIPLANVRVVVTGNSGTYEGMTDSNGYFHITLSSIRQGYTALFDIGGLPAGSAVIVPSGNTYSFDTTNASSIELNGLVSSSSCRAGACWLTAGGVKFDPVLGIRAAENGPRISFGGNTFPGCSPVAGDGGQWNFVDHGRKLHFQGWNIEEVTCGNVSGIPAGSTSPVTPYNYIDFRGVGTLKGIAGNKVMHDPVYFFVHAEDRNEPGNENALSPGGGDSIDRLFMRVYTNPLDPPGTTLFLVDVDGNSGTVDPITITGGNIQIHVSSCP